jgi:hypothetical protein
LPAGTGNFGTRMGFSERTGKRFFAIENPFTPSTFAILEANAISVRAIMVVIREDSPHDFF